MILNFYGTRVKSLELIPGGGGIFDVQKDGRTVFSKKAAGRFPEWPDLKSALE